MGIDIYARWKGQTPNEVANQYAGWLSAWHGNRGYLREAYHGAPYATKFLCAEAFATGEARIPASVLRERLPRTLELVEERERLIYKSEDADIKTTKQSFREFVALCEGKEKETGEQVLIIASY